MKPINSTRVGSELLGIPMVEFIYSIDDSDYQCWQAELLDWSVRRSGMTCRITRLTATAPDAETYRCLNRLWSVVHQWQPSDAQTVVFLDPDMLFVRPLNVASARGALIGQPYGYANDLPWCPLVFHRDDVKRWAEVCLPLARAIHSAGGGWISEIWAGAIGANLLGLRIERKDLAAFNCEPELADRSIIHYCYDHGGFFKQRYRSGDYVNDSAGTAVNRQLAALLNECFGCGRTGSDRGQGAAGLAEHVDTTGAAGRP